MLAVALLAGAAAGCSSQPAAPRSSVTSCYQDALRAIQHHVTVTAVPPACQGLSQIEVNVAVDRALHAAAAGVRGKDAQREIIGHDHQYVARLIRAVPAPTQPAAAAPPAAAAAPSHPSSLTPLRLAALAVWLVTIALGLSMLARWLTRTRRPGRGAALNFTHLGLALTGLAVWIGYLATDVTGLAWAACGILLAVASLGMTLVFLGPSAATSATRPDNDPPPAGRPPFLVIGAHITAAVVTLLLATLAAIGSG
jgi:manganese efflux pump family protein